MFFKNINEKISWLKLKNKEISKNSKKIDFYLFIKKANQIEFLNLKDKDSFYFLINKKLSTSKNIFNSIKSFIFTKKIINTEIKIILFYKKNNIDLSWLKEIKQTNVNLFSFLINKKIILQIKELRC